MTVWVKIRTKFIEGKGPHVYDRLLFDGLDVRSSPFEGAVEYPVDPQDSPAED